MKRAALIALLCAAGLGLAAPAQAVTLVDPSGQPVGEQWQQWADQAQVPTLQGNLTLVVSDTRPCVEVGCSSSPVALAIDANKQLVAPWASTPATTWMKSDAPQWSFYWELGHQFDWAKLTDAERRQFADMWRASGISWWDSEDGLYRGVEDGLEGSFAAVYANCAMGHPAITPGGWIDLQLADPEASCALIDQIGGRPLAPSVGAVTVNTQHRAPHRKHRRRFVLRRHRR